MPSIADMASLDLLGTSHPTKAQAEDEVRNHLLNGSARLNLALDPALIEITFDLTGKTAGQASYRYCASHKPSKQINLDDLLDLDLLGGDTKPLTERVPQATQLRIRLNYQLMCQNPTEYFARTIPHEVAHILSVCAYGKAGHGHGTHWKNTCTILGMQDITRCHTYSTAHVPKRKRQQRWDYSCDCPVHNRHKISTTLHNKMQRGQQTRICRTCRATLKFIGANEVRKR